LKKCVPQKCLRKSSLRPARWRGWDAAGVGGDERAGRAVLLHVGQHLLLDVEPLHHHLDDPVAVLDLRQVIVEVAGADALGEAGIVQRRRTALDRGGEGVVHDLVARTFLGGNVEQQHFGAGVGEVAGDAAAHDAATEYGDFADVAIGHW
jgi:hypothetical protein